MAAKRSSISLKHQQWLELERLGASWRLGTSGVLQRIYEEWRKQHAEFVNGLNTDEKQLRLPLEQK